MNADGFQKYDEKNSINCFHLKKSTTLFSVEQPVVNRKENNRLVKMTFFSSTFKSTMCKTDMDEIKFHGLLSEIISTRFLLMFTYLLICNFLILVPKNDRS